MRTRILLCVGLALLGACERRSKLDDPEPKAAGGEQELFAGCEQQLAGSTGRIYRCGSLVGEVHEQRPGDVQPLLDNALALPRFFFYGSERHVSLELGGATRDVVELSGWLDGKEKVMLAVGVPTEGQGARLAMCMADRGPDNERRCHRMLAYFVERGSLDGAVGSPPVLEPPAFVGKPLVVPEGCEVRQSNAGGGAIHCKDGNAILQWQVAHDPAFVAAWVDQKIQAFRAEFNQVIDGVPELMSDSYDCTIDGVATRCEMLMIGISGWVYIGQATVRGQPVAVMCSHVGNDPYPAPVCNGLIE